MNDKKSKTRVVVIRITFFVLCVAMFIYGGWHFVGKLPISFKKPAVQIQRAYKARINRGILFDKSKSFEMRTNSLRQLELLNINDLREICEEFSVNSNNKIKNQAINCLLRVGRSQDIEDLVQKINQDEVSAHRMEQVVRLLSQNPEGEKTLEKYLQDENINQDLRIVIFAALAEKSEPYRKKLFAIYEAEEEPLRREKLIYLLTLVSPENPIVLSYHRKRVKSDKGVKKDSLVYLAHQGDPWLKENYFELLQKLSIKDKIQLLKLTPYLCPPIKTGEWEKQFFKADNFSLKKNFFSSLLLYRLDDRKKLIENFLSDRKLREKERKILEDLVEDFSNTDKQVCR